MANEIMVECENLVKIYKTKDIEVLALQGLELQIEKGELMAIIGNSGSGKSTFLNMLGGLDRPSAGRLIVDGKDLFKLNERELVEYKRNTVGFVWQNNARNLLPYLSAIQNVQMPMLFGNVEEKQQKAKELLDMVGLSHKSDSRLSQLSGGEQQRVAIAIALANSPKLLLADEPTGSVDVKTGMYILDMFREINRTTGLTIVIVTHDRLLSKKVSRVVSIRDGKISSERLMKQSYLDRMQDITAFTEEKEVQDEFVVLDRAGRIQIPRDMLEQLHVKGNKLRMELKNGHIEIESPEAPGEKEAAKRPEPPEEPVPEQEPEPVEPGDAKLLYQGHGSFRLTTGMGKVIYIDPFAGDGYDLPADLILVTHEHHDHNCVDLPPHGKNCIIYRSADALQDGEYRTVTLAGVEIEAVQAYNKNHPRSKCVGYLVKTDGHLLYFAGDTSETEQMPSLGERGIDYAFLPTDGIYNMDLKEAYYCSTLIHAKHCVPVHIAPGKLFDEEKARLFAAKGRLILKPGEEITL